MSERTTHPGEEELLRFADGELGERQAWRIRVHMERCGECRERFDGIELGLAAYESYHESVLKPALPPPPQAWQDIRAKLDELEAGLGAAPRPRLVAMPSRKWLAAAAALLLCAAVAWRVRQAPRVSAAELLKRAAVAESVRPPEPGRRIAIQTRFSRFIRPARADADGGELRALFLKAGFDWEEPLSAESFTAWRARLSEKEDEIEVSPAMYVIRTSTPDGALAEATLSLRAEDLRPVRETLQFRDSEFVEITEAAPAAPALAGPEPGGAPVAIPAPPGPAVSAAAGPAEELRVIAGLHRIGADLGEPVEVERGGSEVIVEGIGIDTRRQDQIRAAVEGIPGVRVEFEQPPAAAGGGLAERGAVARGRRSGDVERELGARLGDPASVEEFTERVLESSDAALARAHALRSLAHRFPPHVEARFGEADREALRSIRRDHVAVLGREVNALVLLLDPFLPDSATGPAPHADPDALVAAAREVDRRLNTVLAGAGGGSLTDIGPALERLRAEAATW